MCVVGLLCVDPLRPTDWLRTVDCRGTDMEIASAKKQTQLNFTGEEMVGLPENVIVLARRSVPYAGNKHSDSCSARKQQTQLTRRLIATVVYRVAEDVFALLLPCDPSEDPSHS